MPPRNWKRPLTLIYDHNYKYGSSLYSGAIDDIERRYLHSMSRTHMPMDRPDLLYSSFSGSHLSTPSVPASFSAAASVLAAERSFYDSPIFETQIHHGCSCDYNALSDRGHSMTPMLDRMGSSSNLRRVRSVPDMPSYLSEPQSRFRNRALMADPFNLEEQSRARRRRRRRAADDFNPLMLPTIPEFSSSIFHRERPSASTANDVSYLVDKCRQLQSDLEGVSHRVAEAEAKLKAETATAKSKIQQGLSELGQEMANTGRQNSELQKVIKKQAKQMSEMQSLYDDMHRHLSDAGEELSHSQRRCHGLQSELDSIRTTLDQVAYA